MRRAVAFLVILAGAAAPAAAEAATLEAPRSTGIGDSLVVVGRDLKPAAGYELTLGAPPLRGSPSTCGARIGNRRDATAPSTVFSGQVPKYLPCRLPDGTQVGRHRVTPGLRYSLAVCVPTTATLCEDVTFAPRRVSMLRAGRPCRRIGFQEGTEDLASHIRAAGVSCARARAVALRSKRESPRCFARGACSYATGGFSCRGTVDAAELPRVVFRCTGRQGRVTFVKT